MPLAYQRLNFLFDKAGIATSLYTMVSSHQSLEHNKCLTLAMTITNKPTTTEQLSLAFELYHRIPKGRKATAQQLQLELSHAGIERDIRTIQRNLDVVVQYLDVDKDTRNKPYGYSRELISQIVLGPRESIVLQLAKALVTDVLPTPLHYAVESAFQLILNHQHSYPGVQQPNGQSNKVMTNIEHGSYTEITELTGTFEPLSLALTYQRLISVTFINEHVIESIKPLGLVLSSDTFHLVYQHTNNECDSLPLNQIKTVKVLTFHFDYPSSFQLSDYQIRHQTSPHAEPEDILINQ
ncbi:WYL domain-containing protein [Vibrio crassostreae]|uniref:hypothetical protein n=1 Tax=Vibrio crassostreae TaxID=246167 RepID=UPI00063A0117|nr:hypothetical protein [Vibrio crassostreae]CAK1705593.1 WYL domain-containing protein [Vibrio crassostreae]CAK1994948.1 WYL domain-containing protein [Vibrio crassostreae]CAK2004945.1 WYL domain-containing protein [Vibrio crassostreae]CAK2005445.1 WYL domain-containing protein [Vibrio crassostreae]CAK2006240.1 WYL domain-containing protein [Vibrio crassostreae]